MARAQTKTVYMCGECGTEQAKWFGRCPACGSWNTATEMRERPAPRGRHWAGRDAGAGVAAAEAVPLTRSPEEPPHRRLDTGFRELDRVLGGGIVPGSVTLVGGDPGIGKSTLLLQAAVYVAAAGSRVLYVSGEESERQLKERAERLEAMDANVLVLAETDVEGVIEHVRRLEPQLVIADSIQSLHTQAVATAPGSVGQVRECAFTLLRLAKETQVPVFLVGHVTKEGDVAGPRVLEHMVDCVLYLEGERYHELRVLRAQKNRFGATTEIGLFEMGERGFSDVPDPSAVLLADRRPGVPGSAVTATLDGSRALLVEVQALAVSAVLASPQQRASGIPQLRLAVLLGVLRVRGKLDVLARQDVFVSVTGGMRVEETGIDLALCLAVASSARKVALPEDLVVIGEVGLGGELRRVAGGERRLAEAVKLGFRRALLPRSMASALRGTVAGIEIMPVVDLREAIDVVLGKETRTTEAGDGGRGRAAGRRRSGGGSRGSGGRELGSASGGRQRVQPSTGGAGDPVLEGDDP